MPIFVRTHTYRRASGFACSHAGTKVHADVYRWKDRLIDRWILGQLGRQSRDERPDLVVLLMP